MDDHFYSILNTPIGKLTLIASSKGLVEIRFGRSSDSSLDGIKHDDSMFSEYANTLNDYFAGKSKDMDVPMDIEPHHSEFFRRVWTELRNIPYGSTCSYGDIAAAIGNPKASRAVGMANNRNPIPVLIPCHRVVGSDGALVGYGGGLEVKSKLLELERTFST